MKKLIVLILVVFVGFSSLYAVGTPETKEKKEPEATASVPENNTETTEEKNDTEAEETDFTYDSEDYQIQTVAEKFFYAIGNALAANYKDQYDDFDFKAFIQGVIDLSRGKRLSSEEIRSAWNQYDTEVMSVKAEKNLADAEEFLAENGKREGIITTESGLQYEIIKEGDGKPVSSEDLVSFHYRLSLMDGDVIQDNFDGEPYVTSPDYLIPGVREALLFMKEGDYLRIYIHPDLGYGDEPVSSIPANSLLIFDLEIVEVIAQGSEDVSEE